jgi:hypothetical protein
MKTMKRKILLIFISVILCYLTYGQATEGENKIRLASSDTINGWKAGGIIGLSISQASFKNWAAGGQNSFSLNSLISVFANYKKGKSTLDNTLDFGYGFLQQGKNGSPVKTDDKIDFSSKYGRAASKHWYYAALLNFKTQVAPGYNYPNDSVKISDFLAPAYIIGALGMDYRPNDDFSGFIAPITSKTTIVNNSALANSGAFGVDPATYTNEGILLTNGKKVRSEFGGYLKIVYKHSFFKDKSVSLLTKLDLFSDYLRNPQNIVVNWETLISLKVNKFISATIATNLIYDDKIKIAIDKNDDGVTDAYGPRTQFKEVLAIGFSYKF